MRTSEVAELTSDGLSQLLGIWNAAEVGEIMSVTSIDAPPFPLASPGRRLGQRSDADSETLVQLVIVDHDPLVRAGLRAVLQSQPRINIVGGRRFLSSMNWRNPSSSMFLATSNEIHTDGQLGVWIFACRSLRETVFLRPKGEKWRRKS